MEYVHKHNMNR